MPTLKNKSAPRPQKAGKPPFGPLISGRVVAPVGGRSSRVSRGRRVFKGVGGKVEQFLARYCVMPEQSFLVIAAWVLAARLAWPVAGSMHY